MEQSRGTWKMSDVASMQSTSEMKQPEELENTNSDGRTRKVFESTSEMADTQRILTQIRVLKRNVHGWLLG